MFDGVLLALALASPAPDPSPGSPVPTPAEAMALPAALESRVRDEILAGEPSPLVRLRRLVELVIDKEGLGVSYAPEATGSVAQTVAARSANCVSYTMLFLALARAAGLEAHAQEVGQTLSWREDGGIFYRNNHVNAGVRIGHRHYVVDFARDSVIALQAPVPVSDQRLLAYYYNNLAVREMEQGRLPAALQLVQQAIALDPRHAPHWSNAGVIEGRNGGLEAAERSYLKALSLDRRHVGALFNLAGLWQRRGDAAREAGFRQRLEKVQQADPLYHFLQARSSEQKQDYAGAIRHYRRAIQLHGSEHRFHAALARVYQRTGETALAIKSLARAQALSEGAIRDQYETELEGLRQSLK